MIYDPYALAVPTASFQLSSEDFKDGGELPDLCYAASGDRSPQLSWSGLPHGALSVVLTAYDPDAPIPGGLWHWLVKDVPAEVGGLARGAGAPSGEHLPAGAVHLANDLRVEGYSGVQPPPNTGVHRLVICATALSVPALELPADAGAALLNIQMIAHTVGRALVTGTSAPR